MKASRRFTEHYQLGRPLTLKADHSAVVEGRTLFPSTVHDIDDHILKSGANQRKLGSHVVKGKWKGMPIYSLTLEERATCPRSCAHWHDCYGNHMHRAKRYRAGFLLEHELGIELKQLANKHPKGFVVRLHILGDFYSTGYVAAWQYWMTQFPMLRVFGYTARRWNDPIGRALIDMSVLFNDRWWVRWSDRDDATFLSTGPSGIVCPAQTGASDCCGTCGLCWTAKKPIQFLVH